MTLQLQNALAWFHRRGNGTIKAQSAICPSRPGAFLICILLFTIPPTFAHRPYERVAGSFQRTDGATISVVRYYTDGILGPDLVSIQFRLADGTQLAKTSGSFDAVTKSVPGAIEVYQYSTTWLPIADRVNIFDGYTLKDVTSSKRGASVLVHFAGHWLKYFIAIAVGMLFLALSIALGRTPNRGWPGILRWIAFPFVLIGIAFYGYGILVFEPLSPLVLLSVGAIFLGIITAFLRRKRAASSKS